MMNLCFGYKTPEHQTSDDIWANGDGLCEPCRHTLNIDVRPQTIILHDVLTSALEAGDAVIHSDGDMFHFVSTEPIPGSEYVNVRWRDGAYTFTTTAQPWNTWTHVVRSA